MRLFRNVGEAITELLAAAWREEFSTPTAVLRTKRAAAWGMRGKLSQLQLLEEESTQGRRGGLL
jgi:hypothetical protein